MESGAGDALDQPQQLELDPGLLDAPIGAHQAQRAIGLEKPKVDVRRLSAGGDTVALEAGIEEGHRDIQDLGDALQAAGGDSVGALLVLLNLLERYVESLSQLGLRPAPLNAQRTDHGA